MSLEKGQRVYLKAYVANPRKNDLGCLVRFEYDVVDYGNSYFFVNPYNVITTEPQLTLSQSRSVLEVAREEFARQKYDEAARLEVEKLKIKDNKKSFWDKIFPYKIEIKRI